MIELTLAQVADVVGGTAHGTARVVAVTTDSRRVPPGSLFVALPGTRVDGHRFVPDALAAGAAAALVADAGALAPDAAGVVVADVPAALSDLAAHVRRAVDPDVVAVTGSVGKTTTKDLTAAALGSQRAVVAARGSFNNELGVPLTLLDLTATTQALVVEIGARGVGHIASLTPIVAPDVSVVTRVAAVHTEMFGDVATIARAKAELVAALDADGTAVLNADDERVAAMAATAPGEVVTYGVDRRAEVTAERVELDLSARARVELATPWGAAEAHLPVAGLHQVGNALAAVAVAGILGLDVAAAADALADARVAEHRGAVRRLHGVTVVDDAYNASPTAVTAALGVLAHLRAEGARVAVLGVMAELGASSDTDHADAGALAGDVADLVVAVGEVAPLAVAAAAAGAEVVVAADAQEAADVVAERVRPGDVVLVKGSRVAGLELVVDRLAGTPT